jgi:hypothetical protein
VFPTQGYDELFYAVRNSTAAGSPSYHMATYNVLTNSFQAIWGLAGAQQIWMFSHPPLLLLAHLLLPSLAVVAEFRLQALAALLGVHRV